MSEDELDPQFQERLRAAASAVPLVTPNPAAARYRNLPPGRGRVTLRFRVIFAALVAATAFSGLSGSLNPVTWVTTTGSDISACSNGFRHGGIGGCVHGITGSETSPSPSASVGLVLFHDSFSGEPPGAAPAGWQDSGGWRIGRDGQTPDAEVGGGPAVMVSAAGPWSDLVLTATLRPGAAGASVEVAARYRDAGDLVGCSLAADGTLKLSVVRGGRPVAAAQGLLPPPPPATWTPVQLSLHARSASCSVAGTSISVADPDPAPGAIAVLASGPAAVSEVRVTS